MRVTPRKVLKAVVPHGALIVYKHVKPKYSGLKTKYKEKIELRRKIKQSLQGAKRLDKSTKPRFIISLTSYGYRLNSIAPLAVASLFRQTVMPDKIVLWLTPNEKLPRIFNSMVKLGLEIEYCEDLKSYKKLIPALEKYPETVIITVDDDVLYPKDWFKKTLAAHKKDPKIILAHTAREITLNDKKGIVSYWDWPIMNKNKKNTHRILPNGIGGVLYPPHSFVDDVLDRELFTRLAPNADDLWFWAMSELKGTKRALINDGYHNIRDYDLDTVGLWNTLNNDEKTGNDAQLTNILDAFPKLTGKIGAASSERGMTGLRFDPAKIKTPEEQILFSKHQFAYNYAKDEAKQAKALSVLDYGCGDGYGSDFLAQSLPEAKIFATDIDKDALRDASRKYHRKNLQFLEMSDLKTYDLIVSYQVIEHVENVEEYLRELRGMLKKHGKIIISTPDRRYRLNDDQVPWNPFHVREYTKETLLSDIQNVFPKGKVLQLSGNKNMLRIEYSRVAANRNDQSIYGGKMPNKSKRLYTPDDFYLTEKETKNSLDLFALIQNDFSGSKTYWEDRYAQGGNSGAGSYDNLAEFKARVINKFVKKNKIRTVIEFGTGDGNQLLLSKYPHYIGFDVSKTAVEMTRDIFKEDPTKEFYTLNRFKKQKADLSMSLDVLYHLIEKDVFEEHLRSLFKAATRYVIIYAYDGEEFHTASHVQSRKFTEFIEANIKDWKLIKHIPNKYPHNDEDPNHTSRADFYIYKYVNETR